MAGAVGEVPPPPIAPNARLVPLGPDPHSYANYLEAKVVHTSLALAVDFETKTVAGEVTHRVRVLREGVKSVLFDSRGLQIEGVTADGKPASAAEPFSLKAAFSRSHEVLGTCLEVDLPEDKRASGAEVLVAVKYRTAAGADGLQWLAADQTASKKHPFMYSQFQCILARTCLPCQDSPAVKAPYDIAVTVPEGLVAVCSAPREGSSVEQGPRGATYKYAQPIKVPAYLIAFAAGHLEWRETGPRSGVWAEPELLEAAAWECAQTEEFLAAGEEICGYPYVWNTYAILVLPTSFPYGGMENPNCTFMNACLLTGKRELTDVIAHEIAHSWSGNLLTNKTWGDFWLNEGFTMYIERLIEGRVFGEEMRHLYSIFGYGELVRDIDEYIEDEPEWTKLRPCLPGCDPDDAFSRVPYEKGYLLLLYLESLVGGKEKMEAWLHAYFHTFAHTSVDAETMRAHFLGHFGAALAEGVDWDHWFYDKGLPRWTPHAYLSQALHKDVVRVTELWKAGGEGAAEADVQWHPFQTMMVLDDLINEKVPMALAAVLRMDALYQLSASHNVEVLYKWITLCVSNLGCLAAVHDAQAGRDLLSRFLSENGRSIYVKPMYKALWKLAEQPGAGITREEVRSIATANLHFYHSVVSGYVAELVQSG